MSLYDDYNPARPLEMPMDQLYRSENEPFSGRILIFAGITSDRRRDVFNLWLSDLLTDKLDCHQTSREGLKEFHRVMPNDLTEIEKAALDSRAKFYADTCKILAKLLKDPDSGKGPEHFTGEWDF